MMTPEPEGDPADLPAVSAVPVVRKPASAAAVADLDDRVAAALRHALTLLANLIRRPVRVRGG